MLELFALKIPKKEPSPEELDRWLSFVDEPFRTRVKRFRLWQDALRSLGGRLALLWYLLSTAMIDRPGTAVFGAGSHGKPVLSEPLLEPSVDFNIAHDGDYVMLGIQRGGQVGVDIMAISEAQVDLLLEALDDHMTLTERQALAAALTLRQQALALTTIWCAKEAYVKAIGEGVSFGLTRIDVSLDDNAEITSISVDGHDVCELGRTVQSGYLGEQAYRWVCISRGGSDRQAISPSVLHWEEVVKIVAAHTNTWHT